ncbi:XIAP-associated factor 1 [Mastacembelus armatus]|uniref:XIAP associated factor 1 n=1 Tax=Mastacembelus armatus TaxID=205130 RepID=A0A3Q3KZE5_9TELE|nr:XIAP-associated factor 1 [Mastacembelus armatus]
MDKQEATRTCGQCCREVAEANFALHETHCQRFLCLCPDCDEAVPKEQLNQHKKEQHTLVRCSNCNQKMERRHLLDHESDECVERLQTCQFCELQLRWKDLDEHCVVCGSRTTLCKDCGHYVKLRDQQDHDLTCNSLPQDTDSPLNKNTAKMTVNGNSSMPSFPAEDIQKHELQCNSDQEVQTDEEEEESDFSGWAPTPQLISTFKSTSLSHKSNISYNGGDPNQISTCPHCHLALPLITLRWHEVKCQRYILLK